MRLGRSRRILRCSAAMLAAVISVYFSVQVLARCIRTYALSKTVLTAELTPDGEILPKTVKTKGFVEFIAEAADFFLGGNFADNSLAAAVSGNFTDIETPTVLPDETVSPPPENNSVERTISSGGGKMKLNDKISINNETAYSLNAAALLDGKKAFECKPKVLIVHTHSTETYQPSEAFNFRHTTADRTTDTSYNTVRVGSELKKELEAHGIETIHITDLFDYPEYNNSYARSCKAVESALKKDDEIQIVIDLHRDAIVTAEKQKTKITSVINGEKVAQVMLVVGTDELGLKHDNWRTNLKFAVNLQRELLKISESFPRPINLRTSRFNGHTAPGALIVEVGATGNTLDEAIGSVKYLAKAIAKTIK